jgi:SAM-dependent methyltransferase
MKTSFLRHVRLSARAHGAMGALRRIPRLVLESIYSGDANRQQLTMLAPEGFDATYGTDTADMMSTAELGHEFSVDGRVDSMGRLVHHYKTLRESVIEAAIRCNLGDQCKDFVFVDLGCGKAKPLLVASRFAFQRLYGVEISAPALAIARRNIEVFTKGQDAGRFELVNAPAEQFVFPNEPLFLYLYNPFGEETMRRVLENLRESLRQHPRRAIIHYVHPECWKQLEALDLFDLVPSLAVPPSPAVVYASRPSEWAWPKRP